MLWNAVLIVLLFIVGATQLTPGMQNIRNGVFWLNGGRIVRKHEQPARFWTTTLIVIIVSLVFVWESVIMAVYVLMR